MAKRYDEPIEVVTEEAGPAGSSRAPFAFSWRGRRYEIDERLSTWREGGEWWTSNEVREREYFRVLAHPAGMQATGDIDSDGFIVTCSSVYDIYRDRIRGDWRLARLWD